MGSALPLPLNDNEIVSGTVRTADADGLLVTVGPLGLVRARRAAGCLLAPEAGDGVLLALLGSGEAWVLTVLAKKTELGSLALPAHTLLRAESLDMTTTRGSWRGETLSLEGGSIRTDSAMLHLRSIVMFLTGEHLLQCFGLVRALAGKLRETVFRRHGRYAGKKEDIADAAETRTGRLRVLCRGRARLRAENVDVKAGQYLDLDAEHIKVG